MIKTETIDDTIRELARTLKALQALRAIRIKNRNPDVLSRGTEVMGGMPASVTRYRYIPSVKEHAAAIRASLDLTRKLADLRAGR